MSESNWPPPAPPAYQGGASAEAPGNLAGWGSRVGATLLDGVIIVVFALVVGAIVGASGGSDTGLGITIVLFYVVSFLYAPTLMMRSGEHNGQTLGKQVVGIRVVRDTGAPIGFGWAALREILVKGVLGIFGIPLLISYLWPLWDARNQALHDKMVGTFVVDAS